MLRNPNTNNDGQAFDTTLAITVENIIKEIRERGTICQNDVISIESLLGEKIITEEHNINKFCSVRDSFNCDIALESLDDYMRRSFNVHYRISLSRKLKAISDTIKAISLSKPTYSFLRDYTRGKAYSSSGLLVNVNELTINELFNAITSIALSVGGVDGTLSLVRIVDEDFKNRALDVSYSTLVTIFSNLIPNNLSDLGLYDIETKSIRTNKFTLESAMVTIICSIVGSNELMDGLFNINNLTTSDVEEEIGGDTDIAIFNKIKSYDYIQNYLQADVERTKNVVYKIDSLAEELSTGTIGNFRDSGYKSYTITQDIVKTLGNGEDTEYFYLSRGRLTGSFLPSSVYYTLARIFDIIARAHTDISSGVKEEIYKFNNISFKKGDKDDD